MSVTHPSPLSPTVPATPASPDMPPLPDDVRAFCDRHDLMPYIAATARMLREEFPQAKGISLSLFTDPEVDEDPWVALIVTVRYTGDVPTVQRQHNEFLERWVACTPAPVRDLMVPRFSFA